jgi:hypothetical protein
MTVWLWRKLDNAKERRKLKDAPSIPNLLTPTPARPALSPTRHVEPQPQPPCPCPLGTDVDVLEVSACTSIIRRKPYGGQRRGLCRRWDSGQGALICQPSERRHPGVIWSAGASGRLVGRREEAIATQVTKWLTVLGEQSSASFSRLGHFRYS